MPFILQKYKYLANIMKTVFINWRSKQKKSLF